MIAFRMRLLRQLVDLVHAINTKKKRWGQKCNAVRKPWPESSNWNALLISRKGKSSVMNSSTRISCTHVFYMYQQPMHHLTFKVTLSGVPKNIQWNYSSSSSLDITSLYLFLQHHSSWVWSLISDGEYCWSARWRHEWWWRKEGRKRGWICCLYLS